MEMNTDDGMRNIFEREEDDEVNAFVDPYEVDSLPNDFNITSLISLLETGRIKIPSFQRNYVWKKDRASKFIESLLIGLPIPQLFFFEKGRDDWLVIDGQQRLISIYLFKNKRFPKNDKGRALIREFFSSGKPVPAAVLSGDDFENFSLKLPPPAGVENPLNGKNYDTLPTNNEVSYKSNFDFRHTIRTVTIKQNKPENGYKSMYEIYSRLNSGGVILTPQEIRVSLFFSPFLEKLYSVNTNKEWRRLIGKQEPDLHLADEEVLLRGLALLDMGKGYTSPMKYFLNKYAEKVSHLDEIGSQTLIEQIESFLLSCSNLPDNIFKNKSGKFVISRFDAVFVAVCEKINAERNSELKVDEQSLIDLFANEAFVTQKETVSATNVKNRLDMAREFVFLR